MSYFPTSVTATLTGGKLTPAQIPTNVLTKDGLLQEVTGSIVFATNTLAIKSGNDAFSTINSLAVTNQTVNLPNASGTVDVTP